MQAETQIPADERRRVAEHLALRDRSGDVSGARRQGLEERPELVPRAGRSAHGQGGGSAAASNRRQSWKTERWNSRSTSAKPA